MDNLYKLGKTIEFLRLENNLTQRELGNILGVTNQTISKWEIGETIPDTESITKISKLFKISVEELINSDLSDFNQQEIRRFYMESANSSYKCLFIIFIINAIIFILNKFNLNLDLPLINKIALDVSVLIILFTLIKTALKYIKHKLTINATMKDTK